MNWDSFKRGILDGLPICFGYFAVAFTFGMMAVSDGVSTGQAVLISAANVTSAGQFAALDIIQAGGSYWEMAFTQLIINLRYVLMSFALAQKLRRDTPWFHRFFMAHGVTDEIFGISVSQKGRISPFYNYGAMCVAVPGWVLGTLVGGISGQLLPAFMVSALSIAIYGMFLAIIIPASKKNHTVLGVVLTAMAISSLFSVLPVLNSVSSGFVIIITTVLVAGGAAWFFPIAPKEEEAKNRNQQNHGKEARKTGKERMTGGEQA